VLMRDGFEAIGVVRLLGVQISGTMDCDRGKFINPERDALIAQSLEVKGSLKLRVCHIEIEA
jgi:hypothetical protein